MPERRLFWIAIIIVELVFVYVLWKPVSAYWKAPRRAAVNSAALRVPKKGLPENPQPETHPPERPQPETRQPEIKEPAIASSPIRIHPAKPSGAIAHSAAPPRIQQLVINAGLKTPEPISAKPAPPTPPSSPSVADSFWCHLSKVEPTCDCQAKDRNQTANLVMRNGAD